MQIMAHSELRRRLGRLLSLMGSGPSVSFTGDTTIATPNIVNAGSLAGLEVGMTVTGPNIPAGSTIISLANSAGGTVTLNNNATATAVAQHFTAAFANTAQVHLFSAAASPGPEPTPASFTEANFDGYAPVALGATNGPYTTADGSAEADFGDVSWVLNATPITPNTIFGYWVDYLVGGVRTVQAYESFSGPKPMTEAGNAIVLTLPVKDPPAASATVVSM